MGDTNNTTITPTIFKQVMLESSYEKLLRKLQVREVLKANIPGLEQCPFCEFSAIPEETSRVFGCLNCRKNSCRLCKRVSHTPYSCDESKDDLTRGRTYIEEKMSQALIRNCYRCSSKFIREDGCNKMICSCGAKMCYLCRKPIKGYSHFYDINSPIAGRCPLWTENTRLHRNDVKRGAKKAIEEVKRKNPQLKVREVYKKLRK